MEMGEALSVPGWGRSGSTLYLEWSSVTRELSPLLGGGEALRSESDSDTTLRVRKAEEGREGRGAAQSRTAGEALGLGSMDSPERVLYLSAMSGLSFLTRGGEALRSDSDSEGARREG